MNNLNPNQTTINSYNNNAQAYIKNTPQQYGESHQPLLEWLNTALGMISTQDPILELGSAVPRDAKYIQSRGFTIQCSDATPAFVENLKSNGLDAIQLDIINDKITGTYSLILANAVVSHFTEVDLKSALQNIYEGLDANGIFAFSAKQGDGETWIHEKMIQERYIRYWQPPQLTTLLEESGFKVVYLKSGSPGSIPGHVLMHVIAQKI